MTNAKQEWNGHTKGKKVVAAWVGMGEFYSRDTCDLEFHKNLHLFKGYSEEEYAEFLELLDFWYDSEYGEQEMFGVIWYEDGSWSERVEYDGSEWWELRIKPGVPEWLQK